MPQESQADHGQQDTEARANRQASERRDREDGVGDERQRRAVAHQSDQADAGEWEPDPDEDMSFDDLGDDAGSPADTESDELTAMASEPDHTDEGGAHHRGRHPRAHPVRRRRT